MAFPTSQTLIEESHGDEEDEHLPDSHKSESPPDDVDSHYTGTPIKFLPLHHVYSATSPCSGSSIVASKKVRASRKLPVFHTCLNDDFQKEQERAVEEEAVVVVVEEDKRNDLHSPKVTNGLHSPKVTRVYSRRKQKKPLFDSLAERFDGEENGVGVDDVMVVKEEPVDEGFVDGDVLEFASKKKRRVGCSELVKLGVDSKVLCALNNGPRLRESRFQYNVGKSKLGNGKRKSCNSEADNSNHSDFRAKKWFQLAFDGIDPMTFVGLKCKVYWPLDNAWYKASIVAYGLESKRHSLKYEDCDEEELVLSDEQIKFFISKDEMKSLNLRGKTCMDDDDPDYSQLIGLAATFDVGRELEPGDIIWAKLAGFSMWPAVIMDESLVSERKGLRKNSGGKSVPVQFFGTHDFARIPVKQIVSFVKGLVSCFHLKSKTLRFLRSLKEAKIYLNDLKLPKSMLNMQRVCEDVETIDSDDMSVKNEDPSDMKTSTRFSAQKLLSERYQNMPSGYRPVRIDWKDLDRCNVCHMDEEYENNLFLQCDKCRMMVHARCYGEEFIEGVLWLCNLCRAGAPESTPPCHLCPVVGGAMKPTTDGHWAHLACAIWIPETCLSDIKRMEPIDGLSRINKDRWKLLCSICGVAYGACIQCSNNSCRVAYHPLCARAAGLCVELEDEDRFHLIPLDEDKEEQCIRLLSFCRKHKQPSCGRPTAAERIGEHAHQYSNYNPFNKSGCARCEPYDYSARRGRKEPEVLAAASVKRLFIENRPYLVGGYRQHDSLARKEEKALIGSKFCSEFLFRTSNQDISQNILSMADKYQYMKETVRKRLTFGKSRIHGFGIFTKHPHKAGDMVIEYTGEIVRPSVADWRENFIYNSLVGAGTYMFRIDDERVIDATRAGSIAHLINHSCEPNCYSRVITVSGDEHIIIFSKRDIKQWEELTYDYRFFSIDERLSCYCGFKGCRGVVNDIEAEEQAAKLYVPRNELIDWKGE